MDIGSLPKESINRTAKAIDDDNTVTPLAIRTHAALIAYFEGEDLTGPIKGPKIDVYAAFITVLRDEGKDGFDRHRNESKDEIRQRLETTFKEVGLTGPGGKLSLPAREDYRTLPEDSIEPLLPTMLAVLDEAHDIDSTVAVRNHREDDLQRVR